MVSYILHMLPHVTKSDVLSVVLKVALTQHAAQRKLVFRSLSGRIHADLLIRQCVSVRMKNRTSAPFVWVKPSWSSFDENKFTFSLQGAPLSNETISYLCAVSL